MRNMAEKEKNSCGVQISPMVVFRCCELPRDCSRDSFQSYAAMVTLSMRKQTREAQRRNSRDTMVRQNRRKAVELLRKQHKLREVMSVCSLSAGTAARLKQAIESKDSAVLERMLDPRAHRSGRRPVLNAEDQQLIKDRMKFIASRSFAMDARTLSSVMAAIASAGRRGFENGLPSADVIRAFRARNRDITFRNAENKEQAKVRGENYYHVKTYANALKHV